MFIAKFGIVKKLSTFFLQAHFQPCAKLYNKLKFLMPLSRHFPYMFIFSFFFFINKRQKLSGVANRKLNATRKCEERKCAEYTPELEVGGNMEKMRIWWRQI